MRSSEKISGPQEALLAALRESWLRNPEQRLGQLLVNAANPKTPCAELFYLEDRALLERLRSPAQTQD